MLPVRSGESTDEVVVVLKLVVPHQSGIQVTESDDKRISKCPNLVVGRRRMAEHINGEVIRVIASQRSEKNKLH